MISVSKSFITFAKSLLPCKVMYSEFPGITMWTFQGACVSFFLFVLVGSSCYNKMPQTGWLINNGNCSLTILEARISGYNCGQVLERVFFWTADC